MRGRYDRKAAVLAQTNEIVVEAIASPLRLGPSASEAQLLLLRMVTAKVVGATSQLPEIGSGIPSVGQAVVLSRLSPLAEAVAHACYEDCLQLLAPGSAACMPWITGMAAALSTVSTWLDANAPAVDGPAELALSAAALHLSGICELALLAEAPDGPARLEPHTQCACQLLHTLASFSWSSPVKFSAS